MVEQILILSDKQKPPTAPATKKQVAQNKGKSTPKNAPVEVSSGRGGHDCFQPSRYRTDADADGHQDFDASTPCTSPFSAVDFFQDSPWMKIPEHRKADIVIEPLYPRLGLRGGAANAGKVSKLAALASKRRQKENHPPASERDPGGELKEHCLPNRTKPRITPPSRPKPAAADDPRTAAHQAPPTSEESSAEADRPEHAPDPSLAIDQNLRGHPSAFASIMTNHDPESQFTPSTDSLSVKVTATSFNFAEPSPDDIVTKAQSAKGRM
jgi:elongation factor 1 alpha-like protein